MATRYRAFSYFMPTIEELLHTNEVHDDNLSEWEFFIASYFGGKMYRDGDYLKQHARESLTSYNRRKELAYYYNYCGSIIDVYTSHLYRKKPSREYGGLTEDTLFKNFLNDADLENNTFPQFMRDAQRFASVYGMVSIIIDKPPLTPTTVAEAEVNDVRPYLNLITPDNLLDWEYTRDLATGRRVLSWVKIQEDENYRIWTTTSWELWSIDGEGEGAAPILIDSGEHDLGVVPMVNLFNVKGTWKMLGVSDIQDISSINKNIYSQCSNANEIIENTAFPMLAMPYDPVNVEDETETGPTNIIQFDPESGGKTPYWLEPPHSSLEEIRGWIKQDITEIHRIARMGGIRMTEDSKSPRSGISREYDHLQLYALLNEKAENAEHAEMEILNIWALWQGKEFDGKIDYPNEFSVKDLDNDINNIIQELTIDVGSPTFTKAVKRKTISVVLPKESDDVKATIVKEIEAAPESEVDDGDGGQGQGDADTSEDGDDTGEQT